MISAKYHIYKNARNKCKKNQKQIYNTVLVSGAGPLRNKGLVYYVCTVDSSILLPLSTSKSAIKVTL